MKIIAVVISYEKYAEVAEKPRRVNEYIHIMNNNKIVIDERENSVKKE